MRYDIIERHPQNPLLTAAQLGDLPGGCNSVFNSAVFRYGDGYKAILRVEQRSGLQSLRLADSADGLHFTVHPEFLLTPETEEQKLYEEAIYDPRVTFLEGKYYVCYAAESRFGCQVGLAATTDFKKFERFGCIAETENRNLVLFPEKINGMFYRLDRPFQNNSGNIWLCESPDLIHWGRPRCVLESRKFGTAARSAPARRRSARKKAGW
jgi:beta-1,4-mannooligosaccharide/beta-1,4-mannosyl-N-acetylglucosamine phosphorylase